MIVAMFMLFAKKLLRVLGSYGPRVEWGNSMLDNFRSLEETNKLGNFTLPAVSKWIVNDHPDKDLFVSLENDPHNINAWLKYHDGRPMA